MPGCLSGHHSAGSMGGMAGRQVKVGTAQWNKSPLGSRMQAHRQGRAYSLVAWWRRVRVSQGSSLYFVIWSRQHTAAWPG